MVVTGQQLVINNGVLICYGQISRQGAITTIYYPVAYSKYCFPVTSYFYTQNAASYERYIQAKTLTYFAVHTYDKGSGSQLWICIGN